jgi:hypothetical protein
LPHEVFLPLVAHNWCMCLIISFIANPYTISSYQQTLLHTKSAKSLCHCTAYCWADCLQLSMAQCNTQMEKWTWFKYFQLAMRCYYLMHLFSISIVQIPSFEGFGAVNIVWKSTFWADAFLGHTSQCNMWLEYAHLHATHQHWQKYSGEKHENSRLIISRRQHKPQCQRNWGDQEGLLSTGTGQNSEGFGHSIVTQHK